MDADNSTDDNGITAYDWDFGGTGTGDTTGQTTTFTYDTAGTYQVTLTVTDDQGQTSQDTQPVTVTDPVVDEAPVAAFTFTTTDRTVTVDATDSTDDNGITAYDWDFGGTGTGDTTGLTTSYTYDTAGTYQVTLTVTDDQGQTSQDTQPVTVTDPVAPDEPLELALVGDLGTFRASTQGVLTTMQADAPDSAFFLGDLSYGNATEQQWCDYVATHLGTSIPVGLLAGNHEDDGPDGYINTFIDCMSNPTPGSVGTLAGEYGRQYYVDLPADEPEGSRDHGVARADVHRHLGHQLLPRFRQLQLDLGPDR